MPTASPPATVTFPSFVVSLASSALAELGPHEGAGATSAERLDLARQSIAVLEMLREKTRGNLDAEEAQLLDVLLRELQERSAAAG